MKDCFFCRTGLWVRDVSDGGYGFAEVIGWSVRGLLMGGWVGGVVWCGDGSKETVVETEMWRYPGGQWVVVYWCMVGRWGGFVFAALDEKTRGCHDLWCEGVSFR